MQFVYQRMLDDCQNMGRELLKQRDTKYGTEYSSREACRTCPNRCTDSNREKHVNIGNNSIYIPVTMHGDSRYPLQQILGVEQDTPYNLNMPLRECTKTGQIEH